MLQLQQMQKLKATPVIMFLIKDIKLLEHDPQTQYKFNKFWAVFWFIQMFMVVVLLGLFPHLWDVISIVYITEASLWANFATHFSGMSSAIAATDTREKVEDILEDTSALAPDQSLQPSTSVSPVADTI